eukprot:scaffold34836_cov129-Isochrysis_galbana.AAC.4
MPRASRLVVASPCPRGSRRCRATDSEQGSAAAVSTRVTWRAAEARAHCAAAADTAAAAGGRAARALDPSASTRQRWSPRVQSRRPAARPPPRDRRGTRTPRTGSNPRLYSEFARPSPRRPSSPVRPARPAHRC